MRYDAFISYSTKGDGKVASQLQHDLERLVKPWYRRRPFLRIFRDETGLAPGANLDGRLTSSLDQTGHIVVLLSPESAVAPWVDLEIKHWIERYGPETIVPVITGWRRGADANLSDFGWDGDDVPASLRRKLGTPLGVDLRWARDTPAEDLHLDNERWEKNVAQVAAAIREESPDEFYGGLPAMRARARILTGTMLFAGALLLGALIVGLALLLVARAEVEGAKTELEQINETLTEREAALATADAELSTARDDLERAEASVSEREAELEAASERLAAAEGDLDATRADLTLAQQEFADAQEALTTAEALRDDAAQQAAEARAERDQASIERAAAQLDLADAEVAAAAADAAAAAARQDAANAAALAAAAEQQATAAERQAAAAESAREAAAVEEEAVALAIESNTAASAGDAALALVLALESIETKDPPSSAGFSALLSARSAMAANAWQVIGVPVEPFDEPTVGPPVLPSLPPGVASGAMPSLPLTERAVNPASKVLHSVVHAETGRLLSVWDDGSVWSTDPLTYDSRRLAVAPEVDGNDEPIVWFAPDGSVVVYQAGEAPTVLVALSGADGSELGRVALPVEQTVYDLTVSRTQLVAVMDGADEIMYDGVAYTPVAAGVWSWPLESDVPIEQLTQTDDGGELRLAGETDDGRIAWIEHVRDDEDITSLAGLRIRLDDDLRYDGPAPGWVTCARVDAAGNSVLLADPSGAARVVDLRAGVLHPGPTLSTDVLDPDCGVMAELSPSTGVAVTTNGDGVIRVWDRSGRESVKDTLRARLPVAAAALDDRRDRVHLWLEGGGLVGIERRTGRTLQPSAALEPALDLTASADGRVVAIARGQGLELFDSSDLGRPRASGTGFMGIGLFKLFVGHRFAIGNDGLWLGVDLETGAEGQLFADQQIGDAILAPAADVLVTVDHDGNFARYALAAIDQPLRTLPSALPSTYAWDDLRSAALSPDGTLIARAWPRPTVHDIASGAVLYETPPGEDAFFDASAWDGSGPLPAARFDPTGRTVFFSGGRSIRQVDIRTGTTLWSAEHEQPIRSIAISADGRLVAADGGRVVWDLSTGTRLSGAVTEMDTGWSIAFVGSSYRLLVNGTFNGRPAVAVWDTLDPGAACRLAAEYMEGRTAAPYLRGDRRPVACL